MWQKSFCTLWLIVHHMQFRIFSSVYTTVCNKLCNNFVHTRYFLDKWYKLTFLEVFKKMLVCVIYRASFSSLFVIFFYSNYTKINDFHKTKEIWEKKNFAWIFTFLRMIQFKFWNFRICRKAIISFKFCRNLTH